jgi:hypothetical protein
VARETSSGATPKTATGTGALPSKGPMGGQWQFGVDERGKGRLVVAARRIDNSPAFQCRVQSANDPSPAGTTDVCQSKSLAMAETEGHAFSRPGGTLAGAGDDPALKRRAIVGLSRWDEGGRDAGNGHRDGRAPQPSPSRAANGSLGWTNGATALKIPKGFHHSARR